MFSYVFISQLSAIMEESRGPTKELYDQNQLFLVPGS